MAPKGDLVFTEPFLQNLLKEAFIHPPTNDLNFKKLDALLSTYSKELLFVKVKQDVIKGKLAWYAHRMGELYRRFIEPISVPVAFECKNVLLYLLKEALKFLMGVLTDAPTWVARNVRLLFSFMFWIMLMIYGFYAFCLKKFGAQITELKDFIVKMYDILWQVIQNHENFKELREKFYNYFDQMEDYSKVTKEEMVDVLLKTKAYLIRERPDLVKDEQEESVDANVLAKNDRAASEQIEYAKEANVHYHSSDSPIPTNTFNDVQQNREIKKLNLVEMIDHCLQDLGHVDELPLAHYNVDWYKNPYRNLMPDRLSDCIMVLKSIEKEDPNYGIASKLLQRIKTFFGLVKYNGMLGGSMQYALEGSFEELKWQNEINGLLNTQQALFTHTQSEIGNFEPELDDGLLSKTLRFYFERSTNIVSSLNRIPCGRDTYDTYKAVVVERFKNNGNALKKFLNLKSLNELTQSDLFEIAYLLTTINMGIASATFAFPALPFFGLAGAYGIQQTLPAGNYGGQQASLPSNDNKFKIFLRGLVTMFSMLKPQAVDYDAQNLMTLQAEESLGAEEHNHFIELQDKLDDLKKSIRDLERKANPNAKQNELRTNDDILFDCKSFYWFRWGIADMVGYLVVSNGTAHLPQIAQPGAAQTPAGADANREGAAAAPLVPGEESPRIPPARVVNPPPDKGSAKKKTKVKKTIKPQPREQRKAKAVSEPNPPLVFYDLVVAPEYREDGIGIQLIQKAIGHFQNDGRRMIVRVRPNDSVTQALYADAKFVRVRDEFDGDGNIVLEEWEYFK